MKTSPHDTRLETSPNIFACHRDTGKASVTLMLCGAAALAFSCLLVGCSQEAPENRPAPTATSTPQTTASSGKELSASVDTEPQGAAVAPTVPPYAAALGQFNRAAALMEQYEYAQAARAFIKVRALAPDWTAAQFNLGLAYLNMVGENEEQKRLGSTREMIDAATAIFEELLQKDPANLRAHFCLGMLQAYLGEAEASLDHFEPVYDADPNDRFVAFCYAKAIYKLGRIDGSLPILERIVKDDPGFVSAVHYLLQAYSRTGRHNEAKQLAERFRELNADELAVGTFVVDDKYGMAGKYYFMIGADGLPLPPPQVRAPQRILFAPEPTKLDCVTVPWTCDAGTIAMPGLAVADVDADRDLDLVISGLDQKGTARLFLNDGAGVFSTGSTLADAVVSIGCGDIDNDGDIDLWLGRSGPDQLLLNDGQGAFSTAPVETIGGPDILTSLAQLADIDSDGDLDLLALRRTTGEVPAHGETTPAASSVWFNNTDGTYVDTAEAIGLQFPQTAMAAVVYDDFDNDFDLDLVVFPPQGAPKAWANFRLGAFRILEAADTGLNPTGTWSATSGDPNKDGNRDLLVFTPDGLRLFLNDGGFHFREEAAFSGKFGKLGGSGGQFADIDNDGDLDILLADAHRSDGTRGPALLLNNWPETEFLDAAELDAGILLSAIETQNDASMVATDLTGDGRCDVLLAVAGQAPVILQNITPGGHWIELDLAGKRPQDVEARSNNSAIGARVEVRTGALFQQYVVGGSSGPVASQSLRIHAGLGEHAKVDWLRIIWPDAILQGEVEMAANQVVAIDEHSRKPSSCPYLFAWTGSRYEFIADFGGVGGLGYYVSPGQYATPDSTEYLPIPNLAPRDGHYVLQSLTPLEEITYFDEVKLLAVDHPAGTEVQPNEMMAISVSPPDFKLFVTHERLHPTRRLDHLGHDVTEQLRHTDRQYAGATTPDPRFTGLAEEHFVELDFGPALQPLKQDARVVLFLHGWVEYGYSSTNYAAGQTNARSKAPTISVLRDGKWIDLLREVGYPAGLNHLMTVELTGKVTAGDRLLRVSSNMDLYWDEIYLGVHDSQAKIAVTEVAARAADLHRRGYPRAYSPDGRHPHLYDYHNLDHNVAWKLMAGDYTRFGDVRELLGATDDCFVIMGHGEEITLRFAVDDFGAIPPGFARSFILKTDSYCKDMDLYTAFPNTVAPLPFHGMSGYPYGRDQQYPDTEKTRTYRQTWNTRRVLQ